MQDSLRVVGEFVHKLINTIAFIKYSAPIKQNFKQICQSFNLKPKLVAHDVKTC